MLPRFRLKDLRKQIRNCIIAHQMRVPLSAAIIQTMGLVVFAIPDQQLDRLGTGGSCRHSITQDRWRELPVVDRDEPGGWRYAGLLRRSAERHIHNRAVFAHDELNRIADRKSTR